MIIDHAFFFSSSVLPLLVLSFSHPAGAVLVRTTAKPSALLSFCSHTMIVVPCL
jgi:hypothetical protein